jgi:hypothetical protein
MVWAIAFLEAGWTIQWMKWDVFRPIIMSGDFNRIREVNPQLIVGGFSLAIDYMYVSYYLLIHYYI